MTTARKCAELAYCNFALRSSSGLAQAEAH